MTTNVSTEQFYTIKQAAAYLHVNAETLNARVRRGALKLTIRDGKRLISGSAMDRLERALPILAPDGWLPVTEVAKRLGLTVRQTSCLLQTWHTRRGLKTVKKYSVNNRAVWHATYASVEAERERRSATGFVVITEAARILKLKVPALHKRLEFASNIRTKLVTLRGQPRMHIHRADLHLLEKPASFNAAKGVTHKQLLAQLGVERHTLLALLKLEGITAQTVNAYKGGKATLVTLEQAAQLQARLALEVITPDTIPCDWIGRQLGIHHGNVHDYANLQGWRETRLNSRTGKWVRVVTADQADQIITAKNAVRRITADHTLLSVWAKQHGIPKHKALEGAHALGILETVHAGQGHPAAAVQTIALADLAAHIAATHLKPRASNKPARGKVTRLEVNALDSAAD